MKLELEAHEVAKAVAHYAALKVHGTTADDFDVVIRWRGKSAIVTKKPRATIPTLNTPAYGKAYK